MDSEEKKLSPHLETSIINLTETAAIACHPWIGKKDEKSADHAAVEALRKKLNQMPIDGKIVIGEGERDEAPMLFIGEKVGRGVDAVDIAVDPLEGTTLCAFDKPNSLAVIAFAPGGTLLHAPDVYMEKIAFGPNIPENTIHLENTLEENLKNLAKVKNCHISDLKVCILDRERHQEKIGIVRDAGAQIQLIDDGDVLGVIAVTQPQTGIDLYIGIGGAPEGVLAAAALSCLGGHIQGRLIFRNEDEKNRARKIGIKNLDHIYSLKEMVSDDVIFCATGITNGWLLKGVEKKHDCWLTHSLVMHRANKTVRFLETKLLNGLKAKI